jgi:hypothetical protein
MVKAKSKVSMAIPPLQTDGEGEVEDVDGAEKLCRGVETATSIVVHRVSLSVRSSVVQVDSRTQRTQRSHIGHRGLSWFRLSRPYVQRFVDPYIQEHPNRGVTTECKREIWQGIARC